MMNVLNSAEFYVEPIRTASWSETSMKISIDFERNLIKNFEFAEQEGNSVEESWRIKASGKWTLIIWNALILFMMTPFNLTKTQKQPWWQTLNKQSQKDTDNVVLVKICILLILKINSMFFFNFNRNLILSEARWKF